MSKKEELKKNPVRPLAPPAVSGTFSILRILIELVFDEIEYRLMVAAVGLLEKLIPSDALTRILGASLVLWGAVLMAGMA